jgi:predicted MFS family arabinose efflux permease
LRADLAAAAAVALLWAVTPNVVTTVLLFSAAASVAAARTLWGTSHGFEVAPARKLELGAVRAGSSELGYLVGSAAGGLALATGGFPLVGLVFGALFAAAALPHVLRVPHRRQGARRLALA